MNKKEITAFFDSLAGTWDSDLIINQTTINKILDSAEVIQGKTVLDVACGTGVLIPDYINRKVAKCVAVDISQKMVEEAKKKFGAYENIEIICEDAESLDFDEEFDCAVIYNAFPHFAEPTLLFKSISKCLKTDGRITVAHGMSRDAIIKHHSGRAKKFSVILPEADELAEIMSPFFDADIRISTDEIYIVSGIKRK